MVSSMMYRRLVERVTELDGVVRLGRDGDGWGLSVVVFAEPGGQHRAGGFLFPTISELEAHSGWLLRWLGDATAEQNQAERPDVS